MAAASKTVPRISANKLAEYMGAKPARQRQILRDQKYPQDFKCMYYREATEAIASCIASNLENTSVLDKAIDILEQQTPEKIGTQRRIDANIDAIENFKLMLDDIDLRGGSPTLGENYAEKLTIQGVSISVRPEVVLTGTGKSGAKLIGGVKLHFPRSFSLGEDGAGYVSALLQEHCKTSISADLQPYGPYCLVIDVGARRVHAGVKSIVARMKDIEAGCRNIRDLWPSITPAE